MKKVSMLLAASIVALSAMAIPAQAATLECMIFPLFSKTCTQPERLVFSALWGAGIGAGVGGAIGAGAATLSATNSAWVGAGVGTGVGVLAPVAYR